MERRVYLDHNATTPTDQRVVEAMLPYFGEQFGNPSSIHRFGQETKEAVEGAREKVARLIGANSNDIYFTSGGTEADNFAIKGIAYANRERGNHIITSKIEHEAVFNACKYLEKQGFEISYVSVDNYGAVDLDELEGALSDRTILVTIMHANNEVGTIQPIEQIARMARARGIPFHTDAVQTVGKLPVRVGKMGVDLLSLSGHKFYGPKGVGALYIRRGMRVDPLQHGGHHERNMRAGTENVPGIVGLGKACEIALEEMEEERERIGPLTRELERGIVEEIDEVLVNGHPQKRLFNTLSLCIKWVEGESILMALDLEGVAASSGSACSSGSIDPSHVLLAMGIPAEIARGSLRLSLGRENTKEEIGKVLEVFPKVVARIREMSPLGKKE